LNIVGQPQVIILNKMKALREVITLKKTCMAILSLLVLTFILTMLAGCASVGNQKVIKIGSTSYDYEIPIVEITRQIAAEQGYKAQVVEGDIDYMFKSLANGDIDIWPGIRMPFMQESYQENYSKKIELGSAIMEKAPVGWVVPEYVDIDSIDELKGKEGEVHGKLVGFEAGAGMMKVSREIIQDYNLDLDLAAGTVPSMMDRAEEAFQDNKPILFLGLRPHSMFREYSLKMLDDPKGYWAEDTYYLGISEGLKDKAPDLYDWSQNFKLSLDDAENLMFGYQQAGTSIEELARAWIDGNRSKLDAWLGTGAGPAPRANITRSGYYSSFFKNYNQAGNPDITLPNGGERMPAPGNDGDTGAPADTNEQNDTQNGTGPDRQYDPGNERNTGFGARSDYYSRFFESGLYNEDVPARDPSPDPAQPDNNDQTPAPDGETGENQTPGAPDEENGTDAPAPGAPDNAPDVPAPGDDTGAEPAPDEGDRQGNTGDTGSMSSNERQLLDMVNQERQKAGLSPYSADSRLVRLARMKSRDMYENNYFSHTSPTYGSAYDMEKDAGVSARVMGAENIAKARSVSSAHSLFMNSDGHRANILDSRHDTIGIGIVQGGSTLYVTQLFTGN